MLSVAIRLRLLWWKREMKTIGGVLLYVKLLVGLKHLIMVCKVAGLLQTLPECLRALL